MQTLQALGQPLDTMAAAHDIETFRLSFASLSDEAARAVKAFGLPPLSPLYLLRCPMAFNNRGANWLQQDQAVKNPYFGKAMPTCGKVIETLSPISATPAAGEAKP